MLLLIEEQLLGTPRPNLIAHDIDVTTLATMFIQDRKDEYVIAQYNVDTNAETIVGKCKREVGNLLRMLALRYKPSPMYCHTMYRRTRTRMCFLKREYDMTTSSLNTNIKHADTKRLRVCRR